MQYLNALYSIDGVGNQKLQKLFEHFGSGKEIWKATFDQLCKAGVNERIANIITEGRQNIDPEKYLRELENQEITPILKNDPLYPSLLKEIHDPPFLIYTRGNTDCFDMPLIAIVGSRKLTTYGRQVAYSIARDLAKAGICIVSGLAFGIDAVAHQGAIDAGGKTIAVLGSSINDTCIFPRSNYNLAKNILSTGSLLMSEFPVPTNPTPGTFPARNRIMAGMSLGTLVIEAAEKSGSLITANQAVEFNRDVFAIPGSLFSSQSAGCHNLIKRGAKLVTCANDILEEIGMLSKITNKSTDQTSEENLSPEEKIILSVLSPEPAHIDIIIKATKLETSTISSALAMLEINARVKDIGGQNYIRL